MEGGGGVWTLPPRPQWLRLFDYVDIAKLIHTIICDFPINSDIGGINKILGFRLPFVHTVKCLAQVSCIDQTYKSKRHSLLLNLSSGENLLQLNTDHTCALSIESTKSFNEFQISFDFCFIIDHQINKLREVENTVTFIRRIKILVSWFPQFLSFQIVLPTKSHHLYKLRSRFRTNTNPLKHLPFNLLNRNLRFKHLPFNLLNRNLRFNVIRGNT